MKKGGNAFDAMGPPKLALLRVPILIRNLGGGLVYGYRKTMETRNSRLCEKAPY
jgi:gamma-glutamyltranspeptidase